VIVVKKVEKHKNFVSGLDQTNTMSDDESSDSESASQSGSSSIVSGSDVQSGSGGEDNTNKEEEMEFEDEDEQPQKMPTKVGPSVVVPTMQNLGNADDNSSDEDENPFYFARSIAEEQAEAINPYPKPKGPLPLDEEDYECKEPDVVKTVKNMIITRYANPDFDAGLRHSIGKLFVIIAMSNTILYSHNSSQCICRRS